MDRLVYQNDDAMHLPGIFSLEMTIIYFCESHMRLVGVTDAPSLALRKSPFPRQSTLGKSSGG